MFIWQHTVAALRHRVNAIMGHTMRRHVRSRALSGRASPRATQLNAIVLSTSVHARMTTPRERIISACEARSGAGDDALCVCVCVCESGEKTKETRKWSIKLSIINPPRAIRFSGRAVQSESIKSKSTFVGFNPVNKNKFLLPRFRVSHYSDRVLFHKAGY